MLHCNPPMKFGLPTLYPLAHDINLHMYMRMYLSLDKSTMPYCAYQLALSCRYPRKSQPAISLFTFLKSQLFAQIVSAHHVSAFDASCTELSHKQMHYSYIPHTNTIYIHSSFGPLLLAMPPLYHSHYVPILHVH